ncbi:NAD-binding protein [Janibacter limosus]|uniref:NAD-binding protein n=1 Tax=Janibacter limosus TaxID=53458 RepID=A0AC61U3W5_9MICO|nr:NAD-binding protein [Janibacter limosus]UUZ44502.1 NAD-binding protein [Janibacter limosus]
MARYDVAVIGLGRFGSTLALRPVEEGRRVLGVDADEAVVSSLAEDIEHLAVAEAHDEETLRQLDIRPDTLVVLGMTSVAPSLMIATALAELRCARCGPRRARASTSRRSPGWESPGSSSPSARPDWRWPPRCCAADVRSRARSAHELTLWWGVHRARPVRTRRRR